jgi:N-acetylneuraminate synthase
MSTDRIILERPLFIAEISGNHNGSLSRALELVKAAAEAGADAVKFQTYTASTMTLDIPQFSVSHDHPLWGGRTLYSLYEQAHTPWAWHEELFDLCRRLNVLPFSSPFDLSAVDFLEKLNAPMYKIASLETSDLRLIKSVANTGKPLIISTGATEWEEIEEVVETVNATGNKNLTLLVCTSSYPAEPEDAHIRRMQKLRENFNVKVGLSDHSLGLGVSIAAIALGATVVEKHFTLSREDEGADSAFSMEPAEFKSLVKEGLSAFQSLGSEEWSMQPSETESRRLRRSLFIAEDVRAGEFVNFQNVRSIRPGFGLNAKYYESIQGMRFKTDLKLGTPLAFEMIEDL